MLRTFIEYSDGQEPSIKSKEYTDGLPQCSLVNPDSALRCDCGYDFAPKSMQVPYVQESKVRTERGEKFWFVKELWRGNVPLWQSFWLFMMLGNGLFNLTFRYVAYAKVSGYGWVWSCFFPVIPDLFNPIFGRFFLQGLFNGQPERLLPPFPCLIEAMLWWCRSFMKAAFTFVDESGYPRSQRKCLSAITAFLL